MTTQFTPPLVTEKEAVHILFRVFNELKIHYNNDYNAFVTGIIPYLNTVPIASGSQNHKLQIKVSTLMGNSEPSNPTGQAQKFLDTYFGSMNMNSRKAYFKTNFYGNDTEYDALFNKVGKYDDELRLELTYNNEFVLIGLVSEYFAKQTSSNISSSTLNPSDRLYHISVGRPRTPPYDPKGQHGIPNWKEFPVDTNVHFTNEINGVHYFMDFNNPNKGLSENSAELIQRMKPGKLGGRKTIRRKKNRKTLKRNLKTKRS